MRTSHHKKIDTCPVIPSRSYKPLKENGKDIEMPESIKAITDFVKITYNNKEQIELKIQIDAIKQAILSTSDEQTRMQLAIEGIRLNRLYTGIIELRQIVRFDGAPISNRTCRKHGIHMIIYKMTRANGDVYSHHVCRKCLNIEQTKNRKKHVNK